MSPGPGHGEAFRATLRRPTAGDSGSSAFVETANLLSSITAQTLYLDLPCGRQTEGSNENSKLTCKTNNDDSHVDLRDHAERCAPCSGSQLCGGWIGCFGSRVHARIRKSPRYLHHARDFFVRPKTTRAQQTTSIVTCLIQYVTSRTIIRTTRSRSRATGLKPMGLVPPQASFGVDLEPCSEQFLDDLNGRSLKDQRIASCRASIPLHLSAKDKY